MLLPVMSVPIMLSSTPTMIMPTALSTEPCASTTAEMRPKTISERYSAEVNSCAHEASSGLKAATSTVATQPAKNDPSAAIASAAPALPCSAIW